MIAKCLEPDPRRRYAEAAALGDDLRRHLAHLPLQGAPNRSPAERWQKWRRRRPHALARAGVMLLFGGVLAAAVGLGIAYAERQRHDAEAALTEGDGLLRRGLPAEADRPLARGEELAAALPWCGDLTRTFAEKRREARRAQLAAELHRTADELRYLCDPDTLSRDSAAELQAACGRLWEARGGLIADSGDKGVSEAENTVRADLRDLAVLWVSLRERTAAARDEDLNVLDQAEALFGPSPALRYERARLRPSTAEADDLPPRTAWDHYALGRLLLDDGKTDRAADELARAVALQPQGFWPNFYEGVCAHRRGLFAEAETSFRVCVALAPDSAPCRYNHGLALAALGRPDGARADYDRALELDPSLGAAWLNRGMLNYQEKRREEALNDLRQALANGADPVAAHYNLALTYHALGDDAMAAAEARAALRRRPDHAGALELLRGLRR